MGKKIYWVFLALILLLVIATPAAAFLFMLFTDPILILQVLAYCAIVALAVYAVFTVISLLLNHPKTKLFTQIALTILISLIAIKACNSGIHSGCTNSRYIDCEY
jgi:hypothetical protein